MSAASQKYAALQRLAREQKRPASELFTLYLLEAFLERLTNTSYAKDFVLKGGVLLAAHSLRRPTKDIDMQAVDFPLDEAGMQVVVAAVAAAIPAVDDGLDIDVASTQVASIRDDDSYSGLRVTVSASLYSYRSKIQLDISTGDPIWPAPEIVHVPRLLGGDFPIMGHPIPLVIGEKSVTMLQRGSSSTRWRDLMDIRSFAMSQSFTAGELRSAAKQIADYRVTPLGALSDATVGWPEQAQVKWVAWRRSHGLEDKTLENFADQLSEVANFLDPVFTDTVDETAMWDFVSQKWV